MPRFGRWLGWGARVLFGIPARAGSRRAWAVRFARGLLIRLVLLVFFLLALTGVLIRGSLPKLDGAAELPGLSAPVTVQRDGLGIPTITAANRADLAAGLGFAHAQDRYFQMDLARRYTAGELAELLGPASVALDADRANRLHRLRAVAGRALAGLSDPQRAELDAYVRGVNAGLASLRVRPVEYLLLQSAPKPWTAEDSVLVMLSIFLGLQQRNFAVESDLGVARDTLPGPLFELLTARGSEWDAALDGTAFETPPLPGPEVFDLRRELTTLRSAPPDRGPLDYTDPFIPGSNAWAVAGAHTAHGGAIVANDMHLDIRVPDTWYRAALAWTSGDGTAWRACGATLPGCPGLIAGSNGRVAWGLTNSEIDVHDLIRLEIDPANPERYRTPDGWRPFEVHEEVIRVRGRPDLARPVRATVWGPVLDDTEYHQRKPHVLRWAGHDAEAINLRTLDLLEVRTLDEALTVASQCGGPHVNFLAADTAGDIGWTILGRLPRRVGYEGRTPESWADGSRRWDGYRDPSEVPRIARPASGRIWSANNRHVGGAALAILGIGGYDRGARARQIRDRLLALERATEADMLALQLDDRALFLARWRDLLLSVLDRPECAADAHKQELRRFVADWGGRAARESVGYRMVHEYRLRVVRAALEPLTARCRLADSSFGLGRLRQAEGAAWRLVQERPAHLLDPRFGSWDQLLGSAVDDLLAAAVPDLAARTWGERNTARIRHPLSAGMAGSWPGRKLRDWLNLDMPADPLDGGWSDLPRIQRPTSGASQRSAVSPGKEELGYFHMPGGQSGHPRSPHYRDGHAAWVRGEPTPFLPGEAAHKLVLSP